MHVDPQVIVQLRSMFLSGATPWRLVQHIASRHDGEPNWPDMVGQYFADAFSVATIAMDRCPHPVDLEGPAPQAFLDAELLRDMVGRAPLWRTPANGLTETAWFDCLVVSPDDLTIIDCIRPEAHPALAEYWATLPPRVQDFIRRSMVNAQGYYERMQVMALLAERLQQQVVELERHNVEVRA